MSNTDNDINNDSSPIQTSLISSSSQSPYKAIIKEIISFLDKESSSIQSDEDLITKLTTFILKFDIDITTLIDPEKNSIAQIYANDNNTQSTIIIIKSYHKALNNNQTSQENQLKFDQWLLNENISKQTIFEYAVENCYDDLLKFLGSYITSYMSTRMVSNNRANVFHYAAKANNIYALLFFYDILYSKFHINKCINSTMSKSMKPIHLACYSGNSQTVDAIIDLGGDIDAIDDNQSTPLHYAVTVCNLKIVKKLVIYGADKTLRNLDGRTAYEVAKKMNLPDLCDILKTKSVFEKMFKCAIEYKTLKNRRKDYQLSILLFAMLLIQISCYFFIREGSKDKSYCIISNDCLGEFSLFICAMLCEVMTFILIFLFAFLQNNPEEITIYNLDELNTHHDSVINMNSQKQKTLSEMYLINQDMCIKCRKDKNDTTVHCIACDKCVELWDHHCFWLNCCIHAGNKTWFNVFLLIIFMTTIINAINFLMYLLIIIRLDIMELIADIFGIERDYTIVMIIFVVVIIIISIVLVILLYIFLSVIIPFTRDALYARRQRKKKIREKMDSNESFQPSRTALITE